MKQMASRITSIPGVMGGKPCVSGTRIPAASIASYLDNGASHHDLLLAFPSLSHEDIDAAVEYDRSHAGLNRWGDFFCCDCGEREYVDCVVANEVWNAIAKPNERLCPDCLDERLENAGIGGVECRFYYRGAALYSADYPTAPTPHQTAPTDSAPDDASR